MNLDWYSHAITIREPEYTSNNKCTFSLVGLSIILGIAIISLFPTATFPVISTATPVLAVLTPAKSEFTKGYLVGKMIYMQGCTIEIKCAAGQAQIYLVNFDGQETRYAWFDSPIEFLDFPSWSFCDMDKITCIAPIIEYGNPFDG